LRLLLDTHALIWWLGDASSLSRPAHDAIAKSENLVYVSAASAWEIATKYRLGKLPSAGELVADFRDVLIREVFVELAITVLHAERAGSLHSGHRDPFDRMLIAQAQSEGMTLVSNERLFDAFGVNRLW
jgi:PIN domain nuclease of toxin-antitoxin system